MNRVPMHDSANHDQSVQPESVSIGKVRAAMHGSSSTGQFASSPQAPPQADDVATGIRHHDIVSIQYLRGVAALFVVLYHSRMQIHEYASVLDSGFWEFGSAGVDIFFVISGFVMWVSTHSREMTSFSFIKNRIIRIVPLYWLVTLVIYLSALVFSDFFRTVQPAFDHLIKSLLFIPHFNPGAP